MTRTSVRPFARSAAAIPDATAGALPNSECSQGSCQELSGYGVEKTSRQPVAFAAMSRPSVARIAASSTYRAPRASPQPWQARWPFVSVFDRSRSDCTDRASSSRRRLPTAKLPTWKNLTGRWAISATPPRRRRRPAGCSPRAGRSGASPGAAGSPAPRASSPGRGSGGGSARSGRDRRPRPAR